MVTTKERQKGYNPNELVHRWTCTKCNLKYYLHVNYKNKLDKIRLSVIEGQITEHVLQTKHEIIHKEEEPFRMRRI